MLVYFFQKKRLADRLVLMTIDELNGHRRDPVLDEPLWKAWQDSDCRVNGCAGKLQVCFGTCQFLCNANPVEVENHYFSSKELKELGDKKVDALGWHTMSFIPVTKR